MHYSSVKLFSSHIPLFGGWGRGAGASQNANTFNLKVNGLQQETTSGSTPVNQKQKTGATEEDTYLIVKSVSVLKTLGNIRQENISI